MANCVTHEPVSRIDSRATIWLDHHQACPGPARFQTRSVDMRDVTAGKLAGSMGRGRLAICQMDDQVMTRLATPTARPTTAQSMVRIR